MTKSNSFNTFEKVSFFLFASAVFVFPFLFFPMSSVPMDIAKKYLFAIAVFLSFACWAAARAYEGQIIFPRGRVWIALGALLLVNLISALFSGAPWASLLGAGYEPATALSLLVFSLALFLAASFFSTRERLMTFFSLFYLSFLIVVLMECVRYLFPSLLPLPLNDMSLTVAGKWNELGGFLGLGAMLSLFSLEFFSLRPMLTWLWRAILLFSIVGLTMINFSIAWALLGLFAAGVAFVRVRSRRGGKAGIPWLPVAVAAFAILFFFFGGPDQWIGKQVARLNPPPVLEFRPSWAATWSIVVPTLATHPFLGVGPNRFPEAWALHRPAAINQTIAWNTDFTQGVSFFATELVTTGLLGALAWIVFLVLLFAHGAQGVLEEGRDETSRAFTALALIGSAYLWILAIFYVPDVLDLGLAFVMSGALLGSLQNEDRKPSAGFPFVFLLLVSLAVSLVLAYGTAVKFRALAFFRDGAFDRAAALDGQDRTYRALAQQDIDRRDAPSALDHARRAVAIDPNWYQNWITLGDVYAALVPPGVKNAYELSADAYAHANLLAPAQPMVLLGYARLEAARKNYGQAHQYLVEVLSLKPDLAPAIFLRSQIEADEGNTSAALADAFQAAALSPQDPTIYLQIGVLKYQARDYANAAAALERAVALVPSYSNARYFLGLSYARLGRRSQAIEQFTVVRSLNPNSTQVDAILNDLQAGKDPFQK